MTRYENVAAVVDVTTAGTDTTLTIINNGDGRTPPWTIRTWTAGTAADAAVWHSRDVAAQVAAQVARLVRDAQR